jgi:hypothetical protein
MNKDDFDKLLELRHNTSFNAVFVVIAALSENFERTYVGHRDAEELAEHLKSARLRKGPHGEYWLLQDGVSPFETNNDDDIPFQWVTNEAVALLIQCGGLLYQEVTMSEQTDLFARTEIACPLAIKRGDSTRVCTLEKYLKRLADVEQQLKYLNEQTWKLIWCLDEAKKRTDEAAE